MREPRAEAVGRQGRGAARLRADWTRPLRKGDVGAGTWTRWGGPGAVQGENVLGTLQCSPCVWWVLLGAPGREPRWGSTHRCPGSSQVPATLCHKTRHPSPTLHASGDSTSHAQGCKTTPETFLGSCGCFWGVSRFFHNRAPENGGF